MTKVRADARWRMPSGSFSLQNFFLVNNNVNNYDLAGREALLDGVPRTTVSIYVVSLDPLGLLLINIHNMFKKTFSLQRIIVCISIMPLYSSSSLSPSFSSRSFALSTPVGSDNERLVAHCHWPLTYTMS